MKFGTSGLRGLSEELKGRPSALYATAFGNYLLDTGKAKLGDPILIGRDYRDSSPDIAKNCIRALGNLGFSIIDCGTVPTPALAFYGLHRKAAALMITGSHIPADRNGIKFYMLDGEINKIDEAAITKAAADLDTNFIQSSPEDQHVDNYTSECTKLFELRNTNVLPKNALKGLNIGVYQHSTVARDLIVDLLKKLGANVIPFGRSHHFVPLDTEAVSDETLLLLEQAARDYNLDAIVSADGDGDRPLISDETGTPLRGDLLGLITANFLGARVVVTPVTTNSSIEKAGKFRVVRTRVGSPYVITGMQDAIKLGDESVVGFEANGGTLLGSCFNVNGSEILALPTRDCFLPILATLSLIVTNKQQLSSIVSKFALRYATSDRIENFPVETSAKLMAYLRECKENLRTFIKPLGLIDSVTEIDGLRVTLMDERIIHFRPSGNAPEMRCYAEAETQSDSMALLKAAMDKIRYWAESH